MKEGDKKTEVNIKLIISFLLIIMEGFDVVIIGAGPAGMFAARELSDSNLSIAIIEMGRDIRNRKCSVHNFNSCSKCSPCNISHGVGGSGTFTDFKLSLSPEIGFYQNELFSREELLNLIEKADGIFAEYGVPRETSDGGESANKLITESRRHDVTFIKSRQKHLGTENAEKVLCAFENDLIRRGIQIITSKEVEEIEKSENGFLLKNSGEDICAKYVFLCPGRSMASWSSKQANKLGLMTKNLPVDVGIRIEMPYDIFEKAIPNDIYDPKLICWPDPYRDKVRTFCTNRGGFVVTERVNGNVNVNGHCFKGMKSNYTNFAFLCTINLTHPVSDTLEYGLTILKQMNMIGDGKPIMQRLADLNVGKRSTWEKITAEHSGNPTLKDIVPGDISLALPGRVMENLKNGLQKLNWLINFPPRETFLYAPEIKFYPKRIEVIGKSMESIDRDGNTTGIFVAGDGVGWSRGIMGASVCGITAAIGLKEKIGI